MTSSSRSDVTVEDTDANVHGNRIHLFSKNPFFASKMTSSSRSDVAVEDTDANVHGNRSIYFHRTHSALSQTLWHSVSGPLMLVEVQTFWIDDASPNDCLYIRDRHLLTRKWLRYASKMDYSLVNVSFQT